MNRPIKYASYIFLYVFICAIAVFLIAVCTVIIDKIGLQSTYIYGATIILLVCYAIYINYNFHMVVVDNMEPCKEQTITKPQQIHFIKALYIIPVFILITTILVFVT